MSLAFGLHYSIGGNKNGSGAFIEKLNAAGIPVIMKGASDAGLCFEAQESGKRHGVENILIWRATSAREDRADYWLAPSEAAAKKWNEIKSLWPPELDKSLVWWEIINEPRKQDAPDEVMPTWGNMHTTAWLGLFMVEMAKLMIPAGYKLCGPSFSSGEPEPEDWQLEGMATWLQYCADNPTKAAISHHEYNYGNDTFADNYPWHYGRFQSIIAAADKLGIPRAFSIFLTEFGWTYQTVPSFETAVLTLTEYAKLGAKFPQLKGVALWTLQSGWGGISDQLAAWISNSGNPLANWVINNQYPDMLQPQPTADEFWATLPNENTPPIPPPNNTTVLSFENGWTDDPLQPDRRQIPNGFGLSVIPSGSPLWYGGFVASGTVEAMHRLNGQLPPNEQLGGVNALILDGQISYKIQAVQMASGTELSYQFDGKGLHQIDVPVQAHYQGSDSYDRVPPLEPTDIYVVLLVNDVEVQRLQYPELLDREWLTLSAEAEAPFTIKLRFQNSYANSRDLFTDYWRIERSEEPPMKHKAIVVKLPQDMTATEWNQAAAEAFQFRHTMTASHDDMLTILNGGNDESYVKFSHPGRDVESVALVEAAGYSWQPLYDTPPTPPPAQIDLKYRPCQTTVVTQLFGSNPNNYDDFGLPGHDGLDYGVYAGDAFYAAAAGIVVHASDRKWSSNADSGYGWHVVLDHGDYCTVYAHARSDLPVAVGQSVQAGQVVGYSGNTGNSTGYHLHFGLLDKTGTINPNNGYPIWAFGRAVNPAPFVTGKPAPSLPQPTIDVAPYFVPSGQYGPKIVMKVGNGAQPMQLEKRANDVILRKGDGNWIDGKKYQDSEQWKVEDGKVKKGKDTSDAGNGGRDGYDLGWAEWIPQFVRVGASYHSTPTVKRFDRTNNCQVYSTAQANDWLYIKAVIPTWISPANSSIVLNDVLVIEWRSGTPDLNVPPNEVYYFAKNYGYVGWGEHFIVEIADGQGPLTGALDCGM